MSNPRGVRLRLMLAAADSPPFFTASFVLMLAGIPVFLLGGALVRNAIRDHVSPSRGTALDRALESGEVLALFALVAMFVLYPFIARRRQLPLLPYLILLAGSTMLFGPMIYWGWWHEQLPWQ